MSIAKNKACIKPKDLWTRLIGIPVVGMSIPLVFYDPSGFTLKEYGLKALLATIYTLVIWEGNRQLVILMRGRFSEYQQTGKRMLAQSLACLLFTSAAYLLIYYFQVTFLDKGTFSLLAFIHEVRVAWVVTILITAIYESVYFFNMWKGTILEAEQLKRANIQSQFETLKSQVNPHFLFNSLNTLITLIPENQELAMEFVQKLSNVYRYVLQNNAKEVVSLRTELEFVQSYLFLLSIRFGNNLHVNIAVAEAYLNRHIAPLTLQMLLENVIKHNIISTQHPLRVEIYIENDTLVIKNNLQIKNSASTSTKVGLQNIINRYKYLSEKMVEVIVTTTNFIVALPLLKVEDKEQAYESIDH